MKESLAAIEPTNWNERIMNLIESTGKPMQCKDILYHYRKQGITPSSIRVQIYYATKAGYIKKLKFDKIPSFYCYPEWVDKKGKLKPEYEFNPKTKKFNKKL